jgi:hypothetical protein
VGEVVAVGLDISTLARWLALVERVAGGLIFAAFAAII